MLGLKKNNGSQNFQEAEIMVEVFLFVVNQHLIDFWILGIT